MEREVKIGRREATLVISKRLPVRVSEMPNVIGSAFGEVYGYLGTRGVDPEGPPFIIYHEMPEADRPIDLEICAPIARATEAPAGWQAQELPAGTFATIMHVGPYETLETAYDALKEYIGAHDMTVTGPPREVYLSEPDTPPDQIRTIIEFPVAEAGVPITAG